MGDIYIVKKKSNWVEDNEIELRGDFVEIDDEFIKIIKIAEIKIIINSKTQYNSGPAYKTVM